MNKEKEHNEELNLPGIDPKKLRSNPLKAPEGYFEGLTPRVMQTIKQSQVRTEPSDWVSFIFPKMVVPAFGVAVIVIVAFSALRKKAGSDLESQFAELASDISVEQLAELDDIGSLDLIETELMDLESALPDVEEDIIEYVLHNEVELSTLVDEMTL